MAITVVTMLCQDCEQGRLEAVKRALPRYARINMLAPGEQRHFVPSHFHDAFTTLAVGFFVVFPLSESGFISRDHNDSYVSTVYIFMSTHTHIYLYIYIISYHIISYHIISFHIVPVVPHKAVEEVSK